MPRKKQRRAWGSVTEAVRGKKYVLRWPDPAKRCGRATETVHGTYRQACERLDVIHAGVLAAGDAKDFATVGFVYEKWVLPEYDRRLAAGDLKKNTYDGYTRHWRLHIEPRWASEQLGRIKPPDVQSWLDGLTKPVASMSMIVLKRIGDVAANYDLVSDNKFRRPYIMPTKRDKQDDAVYDFETALSVWEEVRGKSCEAPFIIACFGGARTGESLGVKVSDLEFFDLESGLYALAHIVRQVNRKSEATQDGDLKNPYSVRTAVIAPPFSARLREIARMRESQGSDWLADRGDGLPINRNMLSCRWRKECSRPIPFKNLRASFRTFAEVEWGISSRLLELLIGHKLEGVTGAHYMRPAADQLLARFEREYAKHLENRPKLG